MTLETAGTATSLLRQLGLWASRVGLARKLAIGLTAAAIGSGIATYAVLSGSAPLGPDPSTVLILLNIDLVLLLLLGAVIARHIVEVWAARRRRSAGSRLHSQLVLLFSLVAVTPAIVVAVFSVLFFHLGLQAWFSERVRTALQESVAVAQAYLEEHQKNIQADALAMANDLSREGPILLANPERFNRIVATQTTLRSLSEAIAFQGDGRVLARSGFSFVLEFEPVPQWALEKARNGEVAILTSERDDRVRALVKLQRFPDLYLYVGRFVEPKVLGYIERTQEAVRAYEKLEGSRSGLQITFAMIFGVVALLILLAAVWVGFLFATHLARPISGLIGAAERVRSGDLTARVAEGSDSDELGTLSRAFNRMTTQLEGQQRELIEANRQLDMRRRFTEAVLAGVSAGVIGLDARGRINLPNRSASVLLSTNLERFIGTALSEAVPEMASLFERVAKRPNRLAQGQINLVRNGRTHNLLVRIAAEQVDGEVKGFVITFDDVTELLSAQRKAAWADVARRIAHEIKNPLTPIQLSAERLKRKYRKEIQSDPETFAICTDTIIRHVHDLGRMVDEFSSFARMPAPVMRSTDITAICREVLFLQQNAHSDITIIGVYPEHPVTLVCDRPQVTQAITNLIRNAIEAVEARQSESEGDDAPGRIELRLSEDEDTVAIQIEDNGRGLPADLRDRLTEPYVTTHARGTGLGLAIVKKIMEDHGGDLILEDRPGGGALVRLVFRRGEERFSERDESAAPARTVKTAAHGA